MIRISSSELYWKLYNCSCYFFWMSFIVSGFSVYIYLWKGIELFFFFFSVKFWFSLFFSYGYLLNLFRNLVRVWSKFFSLCSPAIPCFWIYLKLVKIWVLNIEESQDFKIYLLFRDSDRTIFERLQKEFEVARALQTQGIFVFWHLLKVLHSYTIKLLRFLVFFSVCMLC